MIGTKIRALCKERGVTVAEVERTVGLGNGVIRKWDDNSPTVSKLKPVADYFGVTVDELLRDDAEKGA